MKRHHRTALRRSTSSAVAHLDRRYWMVEGVVVRADKEHKTLVITPPEVLQPWQKAEMKQRAKVASHANWDDRRKVRELRRELERAAP